MMTVIAVIVAFGVQVAALLRMGLTFPQYCIATFLSMFGLIFGVFGGIIAFWAAIFHMTPKKKPVVEAAPEVEEDAQVHEDEVPPPEEPAAPAPPKKAGVLRSFVGIVKESYAETKAEQAAKKDEA